VLSKSKRKSAVARASARPGSGRVTINGFDINTVEPLEHRRLMLEPASVSPDARAVFSGMDIKVSVYGGGTSSQAQAVRGAIAKSIVSFSGSESIKREYLNYDRFMVVDDARRVEPKKFKGPKARARFQKSYR
jgi:small subunit ribosomal protein S9